MFTTRISPVTRLFMLFGLMSISSYHHIHADIQYEVHKGKVDERTFQQLPALVQVYQEYPYLCCLSPEQAIHWATKFVQENVIWSVAYDGTQLIGAMIALPVRLEYDPMLQTHPSFNQTTSLMLEEAMVLLPYQKQGIGRKLIKMLLAKAVEYGYRDVYLLTVVRSENHPLKPHDFIDLDTVWTRLGWMPTSITGIRQWPTRCGVPGNEFVARIDNMVQYWHKTLPYYRVEI